jgi:cysteinyl-tRNA synthetase
MLTVYNTLNRKKEIFEPMHPPFVGMYVCGPTVYDDPHLGHAKSYIAFDVVVRFLRAGGYKVRYVQNITDVGHLLGDDQEGEDRILKKARLERLEPVEIAQKYERHFFRDMDMLNCLRPDISCRATGHIPEMIELVQTLVQKKIAYEAGGNVYFDVRKFAGYGRLSGKKLDDLKEGVRVDVAEGKRNPFDFALWKKAEPGHLMQWSSPWGRGFPGWHLECSVMSMKYLDESIDIHGGGLDNQFPHHECEIAQSEAATGRPFVKYWLHNNMVTVNGQKMSKSLGNFITIEALLEKYRPMTLRFFILQGHYRSPQDFSDGALEAAQKGFERLSRTVASVRERLGNRSGSAPELDGMLLELRKQFYERMEDDFDTAGALSLLFELVKQANDELAGAASPETLAQMDRLFTDLGETVLGLVFSEQSEKSGDTSAGLMQILISLRKRFKEQKDWPSADLIRDGLKQIGIALEDGKEGTGWRRINDLI